jgi:hypothetical protein
MEILAGILALVVISLLAAFYFGRGSGKDSSTVDIQEEIISNVKKAKDIDTNISTDDKRDWLRKHSSK